VQEGENKLGLGCHFNSAAHNEFFCWRRKTKLSIFSLLFPSLEGASVQCR
jgi:hypothetical protein